MVMSEDPNDSPSRQIGAVTSSESANDTFPEMMVELTSVTIASGAAAITRLSTMKALPECE